jgi:hypothetical protein
MGWPLPKPVSTPLNGAWLMSHQLPKPIDVTLQIEARIGRSPFCVSQP